MREGAVHVRVAAPPEDGRANAEVCRLLAELFGVRPRDVRILSGPRSRAKRALVVGTAVRQLSRALEALAPSGEAT